MDVAETFRPRLLFAVMKALAFAYQYCNTVKAFNNQSRDGSLRHAYDVANSRYLMELQDFTEDSLMAL